MTGPLEPAYIRAPSMISWSDWPARRRPLISLLAAAVIGVVVAILQQIDPMLSVLAAALLLGLCAEALLPTRFTLSEDGVRVDSVFRRGMKQWQIIEGWQRAEHGFLLRGAVRVRNLRHRDLWLRCPEQLDLVEASLRTHLGEPIGASA